MTRCWFLLLMCASSGCCVQQYTSDPTVTLEQMPADYAAFGQNPGPVSLVPAPGNPAIPGQGTALPPNPVPVDPPRRSFGQRLRGLFVSNKLTGMTLPSPYYLMHPPQYFPAVPGVPRALPAALAVVPLQPAPPAVAPLTVKVPDKVAPPTPEQVQAVPADLVQSLRQHFDPSVMPAGGRHVAPPVTMVAPTPTNVAPANPLVGTTWVRECNGCRLVGTFKSDRLEVIDETVRSGPTMRLRADCSYGRNGLVYGVVTAVDFEPEDARVAAKWLPATGSPFCFRVRQDGDTITVSDLRCEALGKDFVKDAPEAAHCVLGTYMKPTPEKAPGENSSSSFPERYQSFEPFLPQPQFPPVLLPGTKLRILPSSKSVAPTPLPTTVRHQSSLDAVVEMAQAFAAENPAVVRALATEAGRAIGRWLGRELDEPRVGEVVGVMLGSALADKLIGKPQATPVAVPGAGSIPAELNKAEPSAVESLAFWLGTRPSR